MVITTITYQTWQATNVTFVVLGNGRTRFADLSVVVKFDFGMYGFFFIGSIRYLYAIALGSFVPCFNKDDTRSRMIF